MVLRIFALAPGFEVWHARGHFWPESWGKGFWEAVVVARLGFLGGRIKRLELINFIRHHLYLRYSVQESVSWQVSLPILYGTKLLETIQDFGDVIKIASKIQSDFG